MADADITPSPAPEDRPLPKCVYFKHGAYWLVKRRKWTRLTEFREEVDQLYMLAIAGHVPVETSMEEVENHLRIAVTRSRNNARLRKKLEHTLTVDEVMELYRQAGKRCAVTGTPFSLIKIGPRNQRPYAPSIDRIDNAKGYHKDNCRIVCAAANIAMNTWGAVVLHTLGHYSRRDSLDRRVTHIDEIAKSLIKSMG